MLLDELFNDASLITESVKVIWARKKGKDGESVVRKYRCLSGKKQGRIVNSPSDCGRPLNFNKSVRQKATMIAHGKRRAKKATKTKNRSPVSKRIRQMNK